MRLLDLKIRLVCAVAFFASTIMLHAQVSFTGNYQQNFDGMGTSSTIPTGWTHIGSLGGDNDSWSSSIPASGSPSAASSGSINNSLVVASNSFSGRSNTRAYNYSGSTTSNRALGTSPTSGAGNILQLRLVNNTGGSVQNLNIAYDIRRFATASSADEIRGYWLFVSVNDGSSWTEITALRSTSSNVPNTNGTSTFNQAVVLPAAVANGAEIRLRWVDDNSNNSSPDQRIGLDNVVITSTPTCGTPTTLSAGSVTNTSAALSWATVSGATSYTLQWGPASNPTANTVPSLTATNYALNALTPGTAYSFRVLAVCGTSSGSYSAAANFTTTGGCGTASNLAASGISNTAATLTWSAVTGATSYNVQWGPTANPAANTVSGLSTTSYALTGLTLGTGYAFQIQAICPDFTGVYSAPTGFTTTGGTITCGTPTALAAGSVTSSSAALSWAAVSGATIYTLQWGPASNPSANTVNSLTTTNYTLGGLSASTSYAFRVQAICSGTAGTYATAVTFNTQAAGTLNEVVYQWSGAIQPTSATVVAKMTSASTTCRALASTSASLTNPIYSAVASASTSNNLMAKMNFTGLQPNTTYYYAIESNGVVDNSSTDIGIFKTPAAGPFSFSFTLGSCSSTGGHSVYTAMGNKTPLFFLQTGDFHYLDPNSSNISTHRTPYESRILSQSQSGTFLRNTAVAHMWDDHDYCGNNNVGSNLPGTANARQAYQEYVPHYPLVAGSGNVPIYQAFTIGRVRFILADLRSVRTSSSMFGATQKAWFKQECLNARNNCQVIAWVTGTQLGGDLSDNWGGFTAERTELGNWFRDNNIQNMFIMSGDAHMIAIDNGTNHDFSSGSNNPNDYPVFAAAALNNGGSDKGGTYSQGKYANPSSSSGQYGLIEVIDNGGSTISFNFKGYRTSGNTTSESNIVNYSFTRNICNSTGGSFMPQANQFTIRSIDEGKKTKVIWNASDDLGKLDLQRAGSDGEFQTLESDLVLSGEFTDTKPLSGWNYYRLINDNGDVISQHEIFVKGRSELKVFPNPSSDYVTLAMPGCNDLKEGYVLVFDALRKCVLEQYVSFDASQAATIDISKLEPGIYSVMLQANGATLSKPILVSR
jgi:alkaline phosphatase D